MIGVENQRLQGTVYVFRRGWNRNCDRLENIFKKVVEAYELLSDPTTRAEIERLMPPPEPEAPPEPAVVPGAPPPPPVELTPRQRRRQMLERLRKSFKIPEQVRRYNTPVRYGCPYDCGVCPDHEQHGCTLVIEITDACNLSCPTCYAMSGPGRQTHRSLAQIEKMLEAAEVEAQDAE